MSHQRHHVCVTWDKPTLQDGLSTIQDLVRNGYLSKMVAVQKQCPSFSVWHSSQTPVSSLRWTDGVSLIHKPQQPIYKAIYRVITLHLQLVGAHLHNRNGTEASSRLGVFFPCKRFQLPSGAVGRS